MRKVNIKCITAVIRLKRKSESENVLTMFCEDRMPSVLYVLEGLVCS